MTNAMRDLLERVRRGELGAGEAARALRVLAASRAPVDATPGRWEDEGAFLEWFHQRVAAGLKLAPQQFDLDRPLSDYGLTSITVTALLQELNAALGTNVAPTVIFEFSTPRAFARQLHRMVAARARAVPAPAAGGATPPPPLSAKATATEATMAAPARADIESEMARLWAEAERALDEPAAVTTPPAPACEPPQPPVISPAPAPVRRAAAARPERIAIVGLAGVLPQCGDLEEFWTALAAGRDLISEAPQARWNWREHAAAGEPGARWGGFIRDVDCFDAPFFGISPLEAKLMDPQQRIFLQTTWHCLENAGYRPADLAGSAIGVFVGVSTSDYFEAMRAAGAEIDAHTSTGFAHSLLANRVSFLFDWRGPSQIVDTACSSSLIALHRAVQAITAGDCTAALVGGVNLLLTPTMFLSFTRAGMLSPDGRCHAFDRRANGYVRGEGAGAVLLKPLAQAEADGDTIHGVILSSAENHGGRATSLTAPNPAVQAELLMQAYERAGVDPRTVGYIETHGTGTALGDPLEFTGLRRAYAELIGRAGPSPLAAPHRCMLGSVKTNIGHLESAAGIVGLLKVLLALRHGWIPPSLHFEQRNPHIDFADTPFAVAARGESWSGATLADGSRAPRRAGVSSFGFGGAYAHVVVEEAGSPPPAGEAPADGVGDFVLVSALSPETLRATLERWRAQVLVWCAAGSNAPRLIDVAATSRAGRVAHACRVAFQVRSLAELEPAIESALRGEPDERVLSAPRGDRAGVARSVFAAESGARPDAGPRGELVRRWCDGHAVAWRMGGARRVPLPLHAFERTRFWFDVPGGAVARAEVPRRSPFLHYEPHWEPATLESQDEASPVAVLGSPAMIEALRAAVPAAGVRLAALADGPDVFRQLLQEGVTRFVFASESLLPRLAAARAGFVFKPRAEWNVHAAVRLAQAAVREAAAARPIILGVALHAGGGIDAAREDALAALLMSGYMENASFVGHTLRFTDGRIEPTALLATVVAEVRAGAAEPREVEWGASGRRVRELRETAARGTGLKLRSGATYLLAGGGGEVGRRLAGWLARDHAATVIVTGRREPDAATAAQRAAVSAGEGRIVYHRADVNDPDSLAAVVREISATHGPLRGVFHLARAVEPGLLSTKDEVTFERVIAAKVDGAIQLDAATAGEPLDFFVLFSSIAGDWGLAGAADYAYACRFQREFAAVRAHWAADGLRHGRTIAIAWPQWCYDAHSHAERDRFLEDRGFALLDETAAFGWLARELDPARPHAAFVTGEAARLRSMLAPAARRAALAPAGDAGDDDALRALLTELSDAEVDALFADHGGEPAAPSPALPPAPRATERAAPPQDVRGVIRGILGAVLQHLPAKIGGATPFERLGMDSILGVRIVQRLEHALGISVPPRWVVENPTIDSLAEKIRQEWPTVPRA